MRSVIDSSSWTGRPSEIRRATGPYGEFMSEADDWRMYRDFVREERRWRLGALAMLWGPPIIKHGRHVRERGEEWTIGRAIVASLALILNRTHGRREAVLHKRRTGSSYAPSADLGHWDGQSSGYGWSALFLHLYPGARIAIVSDGESWL